MGFKCKCSLPPADIPWSPLVTSVNIYTRNNNKKIAALANMGNPHIIVCVTVVHLHIPCGGDEKAPGGNPKAPRKIATPKSSNVKKSPLSQGSSAASLCVLEPAV